MALENKESRELIDTFDSCLDIKEPKSVFLFAGAGSGKTRSLIEAMRIISRKYGKELRIASKNVAVITYTNAARDEIKHRIDYDPIFSVSTIHSFAWDLIKPYSLDICEWLRANLVLDIQDLQERQARGRQGKAARARLKKIELIEDRIKNLNSILHFTYNPNGENTEVNSLNHSEVIKIASDFIANKPLMQKILIQKYPFMLIDESQDTQKDLIDALFKVQELFSDEFCLALFGDMMQRIYFEGRMDLDRSIPDRWEKPEITKNFRSSKRIVKLINSIRSSVDDHLQIPREDAPEGFVRLFLIRSMDINKSEIESHVAELMAEITSDEYWSGNKKDVKILTLEHHMAAQRGGFMDFFGALYQINSFKNSLLDGTLSGIPFFSQQVLPLVQSLRENDLFEATNIIRRRSPLLIKNGSGHQEISLKDIQETNAAVSSLFKLWEDGSDPTILQCLREVAKSGLFELPSVFILILSEEENSSLGDRFVGGSVESVLDDQSLAAWREALSVPFSQFEAYVNYISDKSIFGTHQGIKGLQFPRVLVVLDDEEARGFMFSYDKLFGAKELSSQDIKNEENGKETSIDRTKRLLYVTCSRAQESLAIVMYSNEHEKIKRNCLELRWFDSSEIIILGKNGLLE